MAKDDRKTGPVLPPALPQSLIDTHLGTLERPMQQWLESGKIPPVILLSGPRGIGKSGIVRYLAQWILCERGGFSAQPEPEASLFGGALAQTSEPTSGKAPCGECGSCHRAQSGNWIDFTEITTADEDSAALKIEQFRNLKSTQGFGGFQGAFRIFLIRDAERMTVQAANSILKLLEEPPPGWVFFLTVADPTLLLSTIVSRCQTFRLRPLPDSVLSNLLESEGIAVDRLQRCVRAARGSMTQALALSQDEVWKQRESILNFLDRPTSELSSLVEWASQEDSHFEMLIDTLEDAVSQLLQWSVEPQTYGEKMDRPVAGHAVGLTRKLGSAASRAFWESRALGLFQTRARLHAPLNRKLLIQDLLIPWLNP